MGSAKVPLSKVEVAGGAEVWAELSREKRPPEELQELLLSLSYLPSAERLTVVVLKARNLLPPQEGKDALGKFWLSRNVFLARLRGLNMISMARCCRCKERHIYLRYVPTLKISLPTCPHSTFACSMQEDSFS